MENTFVSLASNFNPTKSKYSNSFTDFARSPHTLNAYLSDWEDFCMWCMEKEVIFLPASPQTVADYLADRAKNSWIGITKKERVLESKNPLKLSSLLRRLAAISQIHKENEVPFERSHKDIRNTINGYRKSFQQTEVRKSAILTEDIRKMIERLPHSLIGKRDQALLLIGFAGGLRRSEIASIQIENLRFAKEGLEIFIPYSKTGSRKVLIPYGSNPATCPIRATNEWLNVLNETSGPLFRPINRHNQIAIKCLSDKAVALIIKRNAYIREKIELAKRNPLSQQFDFSGHSLRAGFVTSAIVNGALEFAIMEQTGHKKSDTIKKYIRETNKWRNSASIKLGL